MPRLFRPISFRPLLLCPALVALFLPALPSLAQDMPATPSAPTLYKRAVAHLDEGRWFESAIADLTAAVRQDPQNSDYHLALGCAEADRAGSLAYAAYWTDQLLNGEALYPKDLAAWQAAQQDPKADGYGTPAPTPPLTGTRFQTKDDLKYLRLTGRQAVTRAVALGWAAQGEWVQAVKLAKTPQARAQAESVGGWGLLYERRLLTFTGYAERIVPHAPKPMDAVAAFRAAVKDDAADAAYWEGLGDAYPYNEYDPDTDAPNTGHAPDIIRAWQKSLALDSRNTDLRFRLYDVQSASDPKGALETLKAVAASDPGNSFLQYGLAALLFKQVHYSDVHDRDNPATADSDQPPTQEQADTWRNKVVQDLAAKDEMASEQIASDAVDAIERGNAGSHYDIPDYTPPVPKILWYAWDYWGNIERLRGNSFMFSAKLRELARATGGYSLVAAHNGNEANGVRAANACIGMGMKMVGGWPLRDKTSMDGTIIRAFLGNAIVSIGCLDLQRVYEQTGDTVMAQAAAAEYEALKQKQKAYGGALSQIIAKDQETDQAALYNSY